MPDAVDVDSVTSSCGGPFFIRRLLQINNTIDVRARLNLPLAVNKNTANKSTAAFQASLLAIITNQSEPFTSMFSITAATVIVGSSFQIPIYDGEMSVIRSPFILLISPLTQ